MVSFDVESLFTNIPLDECIDLGVSCISKGIPYLKLDEPELLFNGSLYDQIDGVAMGSSSCTRFS